VRIAWWGTRAARRCQLPDRLAGVAYRQAHNATKLSLLQVPPGGTALAARRSTPREPTITPLLPGDPHSTAKRRDSTRILVSYSSPAQFLTSIPSDLFPCIIQLSYLLTTA